MAKNGQAKVLSNDEFAAVLDEIEHHRYPAKNALIIKINCDHLYLRLTGLIQDRLSFLINHVSAWWYFTQTRSPCAHPASAGIRALLNTISFLEDSLIWRPCGHTNHGRHSQKSQQ